MHQNEYHKAGFWWARNLTDFLQDVNPAMDKNKLNRADISLPSFYPFFYEHLKNSTFNDLLRKILTNKVALKKIQHKEAAIGIN